MNIQQSTLHRNLNYYLFRIEPEEQPESLKLLQQEQSQQEEKRLFCIICKNIITTQDEQISVNGGHTHEFTNPNGLSYRIGCFRIVTGCKHTGPTTSEWSWFAGYSWQVANCGACGNHLGWLFQQNRSADFYGLIINQLTSGK